MDEFTKKKVKRALIDNPDLSAKFVITIIRQKQEQEHEPMTPYVRRKKPALRPVIDNE